MSPVEVAGFITGALCVWLVARQNPWNPERPSATLSRQLADHFQASWIAECGREHTEHKLNAARAFAHDATVDTPANTCGSG